jgi:hypothetical protein
LLTSANKRETTVTINFNEQMFFTSERKRFIIESYFGRVKPACDMHRTQTLICDNVICHLVGVPEDGKQSDKSIFRKIGVFNRLKNQLIFAVTGERVKVSI